MIGALYSKLLSRLPEKYREVLSHFSYVFTFQIGQQALTLISFFFIVHHLPKEVIGHYQFVLSVIALVSITSLSGMRGALMQSVARGKTGFFKIASRYCFLGGLLGSVILGGMSFYFFYSEDQMMAAAFLIAAVFNPVSQGLMIWKGSYTGAERFKMLSISNVLCTLAVSLFLVGSIFFYTGSHIVLLAIAVVIPAMQNFIMWYSDFLKYRDEVSYDETMIGYGLKTSGYSVFQIGSQQVDRLAIYNFMSAEELAAYNVAMRIPDAIKSIFQNLGYVIMPKFARMRSFSLGMNKNLRLLSITSFLVIVTFAFTIFPVIFRFIVPSTYEDSLLYAQVLLCSVAVGNHAILQTKYIMSQGDSESFRDLTLVSTIIKILTVPILVYFFGTWGAIAAVFMQRITYAVFASYLIHKKFREAD